MKTTVYAPMLSNSQARTKGYGTTKHVYVIQHPGSFKNITSRGVRIIADLGTCRTDYGMKKGHSWALFKHAEAIARNAELSLDSSML